jgi:hypothetical protein
VLADLDFIPSLQAYPSFAKCCLVGEQRVPVRRHGTIEYDDIAILLVVIRLESVGADLLITINALASEVSFNLSGLALTNLDNHHLHVCTDAHLIQTPRL